MTTCEVENCTGYPRGQAAAEETEAPGRVHQGDWKDAMMNGWAKTGAVFR